MQRSKPNTHLTPGTTNNKRNTMVTKPPTPPTQNVAFAVNYSLPSVDQFVATARTPADQRVRSTAKSTKDDDASQATPGTEQDASVPPPQRAQLAEKDMNRGKRTTVVGDNDATTPTTPAKRSSNRDRKPREKTREKVRVRYDMNHVPVVQRHDRFVAHHRRSQVVSHHPTKRRALPPRRSARNAVVAEHNHDDPDSTCHKCKGEEPPAPFVADSSVVWIPTKRTEWEDCVSEMTAVCTSAALRRHVANKDLAPSKPFFAPLSQAYIRDRIDIDDPLEGYQIRHKTGGWLQGFIMWTNFTTWTHYFKWDSLDERSGVLAGHNADQTRLVDLDGSLSTELEAQPRSGDPLTTGLVSPTIAEIGLLGGIGCGEYLLRMAIDDIKSRGQYKYIVMQATDASKTFYERFGFVRVGAVCRYGSNAGRTGPQRRTTAATAVTTPATETEIVGYRHWTYANERNLDTYGGPSYMMALRLPSNDGCAESNVECLKCSTEVKRPSVIEQLKAVAVDEKPKVAQLAASSTPFKKSSLLLPLPKPVAPDAIRTSPYPPGVKRRGRPPKWPPTTKPKPAAPTLGSVSVPAAKPRGRPPKATKRKATSAVPAKKKKAPAKHRAPGKYPPGAKRRGRPPKFWPPASKPGPGRPRKYPLPAPVPAKRAPISIEDSVAAKKKGPGRPRKHPLPEQESKKRGRPRKHPLPEPVVESGVKRKRAAASSENGPNRMQRNTTINVSSLEEQREVFMAPVSEGEKLSFSQKQYQSVWLAVPPTKTTTGGRRPPRQREAFMGDPAYFRKKRQTKTEGSSMDGPPTEKAKKASPYPPGVKRRGRPPKKARGRPPKKSTTTSQEPKLSPYPPGVKRRGRPPKKAPLTEEPKEEKPSPYPPGVKRRGRPPKKAPTLTDEPKEEKPSPYPPGVKRRGRPPKKAPTFEESKMEPKVQPILRRSPRRA